MSDPFFLPCPPPLSGGFTRSVLRDLRVNVRVGVHPWEKHGPQEIQVNVAMYSADSRRAPEALADVVDYDAVRDLIVSWSDRPHTELLETLLEELLAKCFEDTRVCACWVSIVKPTIFSEAAAAGVETFRIRD